MALPAHTVQPASPKAGARRDSRADSADVLAQRPAAMWIQTVFLFVLAVVFLIPLAWMLVTSVRPDAEITRGVVSWVPHPFTLENYNLILSDAQNPIGRWFFNSALVSVVATALTLVVTSLAAYALSRLQFPGREAIFIVLLTSMLIPPVLLTIPLYNEFANAIPNYSLIDTYWPLILPYASSVFGVFLLRQFYLQIPKELDEAAMIDGAGKFRRWYKVIMPLSKSSMLTLGILTFMGVYNDYLGPLLFTTSATMRTVTVGIALVTLGSYTSNYGPLMAFSAIAALPVVVIFLLLQRYFIGSSTSSGVKG
jgi:multiple sugar transport system permease protein